MCGIVGVWAASPTGHDRELIEEMTATLYRRGPDAGAVWIDSPAGLSLGHRRLAILDLSERGAQPMHSSCGRYVIVFNGEIYNHLLLRKELEGNGSHHWLGTSDTETLLACFAAWGIRQTLEKTVGMFALALWDRRERRLTLARDRFGEKPLYYGWTRRGESTAFIFGSEVKALRAHPDLDTAVDRGALALFLRFAYVPAPYSIYKDIFKLDPGTLMTLDASDIARRTCKIEPYWRLEDVALNGLANPIFDEGEAIGQLEHALRESIMLQLLADVPLGAFLSGGIDSSTVVALMQAQSSRPVKTFTIGFNERGFDESAHAAAVAAYLGTDHHEVRISTKQTQAIIPELSSTYDEPFADSSQIPTSIICKVARQSVTVALSGDGGDELFGGYDRHIWGAHFWQSVGWMPLRMRQAFGSVLTAIPLEGWNILGGLPPFRSRFSLLGHKIHKLASALATVRNVDELYYRVATEWTADAVPVRADGYLSTKIDTVGPATAGWLPEQRMMLLDGLTYLPDDILAKVDRAAMSVSLETRVPMLDHRVAEIAWRLPPSMKIRHGCGKWPLRTILHRHVPAKLVERPKAGFTVPIGQWLRGPLRDWAESLISERRLRNDGFLDGTQIQELWRQHLSEKRDWSTRLWSVLMFQAWLETQNNPQSAPAPKAIELRPRHVAAESKAETHIADVAASQLR